MALCLICALSVLLLGGGGAPPMPLLLPPVVAALVVRAVLALLGPTPMLVRREAVDADPTEPLLLLVLLTPSSGLATAGAADAVAVAATGAVGGLRLAAVPSMGGFALPGGAIVAALAVAPSVILPPLRCASRLEPEFAVCSACASSVDAVGVAGAGRAVCLRLGVAMPVAVSPSLCALLPLLSDKDALRCSGGGDHSLLVDDCFTVVLLQGVTGADAAVAVCTSVPSGRSCSGWAWP